MYTFLSVVYVLVCSFLIMVVLLQQGRGGGMGSLGGGGGQTVFGGSGAGNLLTRLTTISAALFMILSATLAWLSSSGDTALEDAMHQREAANHEQLDEALHSDHEEGATTPAEGDHAAPAADHATPAPTTEGTAAPVEPAHAEAPPSEEAELEAAPSGPAAEGEHVPSAPPPSAL